MSFDTSISLYACVERGYNEIGHGLNHTKKEILTFVWTCMSYVDHGFSKKSNYVLYLNKAWYFP